MSEQNEAPKLHWIDREERRWSTRVDVPTSIALRDAGYDLADHEAFANKIADPYLAADFAYTLHKKQCEVHGVTEPEFLDLITDEAGRIEEVIDACVEGAADFLSRLGDRQRATIVRKAWTAAQLASERSTEKLSSSKVDDAIEAAMHSAETKFDAAIDQFISGEISTNSSASTDSPSTASDSASSSIESKAGDEQPGSTHRQ